MTYVTEFAHDIFVSYSTVDNEVLVVDGDQKRGWVDVVLDKLRMELRPRLGRRDCDILIDHEFMRSCKPITPQILQAVRSSAALLVIMSPAYLESEWCARERREFLDEVKERAATGRAMYVVRARPVARDEQPEEFRDIRGLEFFTKVEGAGSHRVLGYPEPNERPFLDRIITLAGEIVEELNKARTTGSTKPKPPNTGKRVFVATTTDDLEEREAELRNYLQQAGIDVLPSSQSRYPTDDLAKYEAAITRELEHCSLFAQLLSSARGKELEFAPGKRLPALQNEIARRKQVPVLQWRERDQAIETKDSDHRALLEHAQACGIEEFKRTVVEQALRPTVEEPAPPRLQLEVFVNADARDRSLAADLSQALADLDVDCYGMPEAGSPADVRVAFEKNVTGCDGIVLVYGKTEFYWVQEQIRQVRKVSRTMQSLPMMAVFEGPPSEKPELSVTIKNLLMVDCRKGLDRNKLNKFVESLRK